MTAAQQEETEKVHKCTFSLSAFKRLLQKKNNNTNGFCKEEDKEEEY
jgi:hypothetical protein